LPRTRELERLAADKGARADQRTAIRIALARTEQDAREAAEELERALDAVLAPLEGAHAELSLVLTEEMLRLAIADVLGIELAHRIRNRVAGPEKPLLICRGNPLIRADDDRFDYIGPRGCYVVYRGRWRQRRKPGHRVVPLGPRCPRCNGRITEDRQALGRRRQRLS
jgi:hypothetical protein